MYNLYNRKTKESFQKQLFEKFPDLEVIGDYINNKTKILLNGILHYEPVLHFGGVLKFDLQLLRDNYVRNYCKLKNIKLLEISYKLSEIEILNILESNLL